MTNSQINFNKADYQVSVSLSCGSLASLRLAIGREKQLCSKGSLASLRDDKLFFSRGGRNGRFRTGMFLDKKILFAQSPVSPSLSTN
jgi:hypothetical protein